MRARIEWRDGVSFDATAGSGHTITTDGPEASGGKNRGARPMELVLLGVGACASYDVVTILEKGRQPVSSCVATVEAERAEEPPRVFTKLKMHFVVSGEGLSDKKVARAVSLSAEKYCSASIMLSRGGVAIEHSYQIVDRPDGEDS